MLKKYIFEKFYVFPLVFLTNNYNVVILIKTTTSNLTSEGVESEFEIFQHDFPALKHTKCKALASEFQTF